MTFGLETRSKKTRKRKLQRRKSTRTTITMAVMKTKQNTKHKIAPKPSRKERTKKLTRKREDEEEICKIISFIIDSNHTQSSVGRCRIWRRKCSEQMVESSIASSSPTSDFRVQRMWLQSKRAALGNSQFDRAHCHPHRGRMLHMLPVGRAVIELERERSTFTNTYGGTQWRGVCTIVRISDATCRP